MTNNEHAPSVYPTLRYDDARAAIEFLTKSLGLVAGEVHEGPDGQVMHAELSWGNGVVMVSSRPSGEPDVFDTGTAVIYLAVDDPDAAHDRAVAAGAEIVRGLTDQDYGSRDFAARDPEGNVWSFGTYRPAAVTPAGRG